MPPRTNKDRIERARQALETYAGRTLDEQDPQDLISDLLHFVAHEGVVHPDFIRYAIRNFEAETMSQAWKDWADVAANSLCGIDFSESEGKAKPKTEFSRTISVPAATLKKLNGWLKKKTLVKTGDNKDFMHTSTALFRGGYEVDISIVNSYDGPYVNPVLLREGEEALVLGPRFDRFDGEYVFKTADATFTVKVKEK